MRSLYPSEVLAFNTHAKGLAYMNFTVNAVNVLNISVPPLAIANTSWMFYILYTVWDAFSSAVIYLSEHPVKASLEYKTAAIREDGSVKVQGAEAWHSSVTHAVIGDQIGKGHNRLSIRLASTCLRWDQKAAQLESARRTSVADVSRIIEVPMRAREDESRESNSGSSSATLSHCAY